MSDWPPRGSEFHDSSWTEAKLSSKERTILLMREEGITHREIAEEVGTTTKSIGTMIDRALQKLARYLGESAEELE